MDEQLEFTQHYPLVAAWAGLSPTRDIVDGFASGGLADDQQKFRLDPELLGKLLHGILFSRKLVATYYIVIVGSLSALTIVHWAPKLWNRLSGTRTAAGPKPPAFSDGAPRTYGSLTTATDTATLRTVPAKNSTPNREGSFLWTIECSIKSWLLYQPRPIPVVNKVLPPNETSIAVLVLIGINTFYTLFMIEFDTRLIFVFASRCGLLFVANLPLLYILAAKNQPIKFLTGHSYESLNIYHRRLGEYMCLLALLHAIGTLLVYLQLRTDDFTFLEFLTRPVVLLGLGSFVCYQTIYTTSLASIRQAWYEMFLALHVSLQLGALILVFFHHSQSRLYVGIALGITAFDRLLFRLWLKSTTLQTTMIVHPDQETVSLTSHFKVPTKNRRLYSIIKGIRGSWQPAEHVFISTPSLGFYHIFQAHPFTIASPTPTQEDVSGELHLLVRAQDGFSRDLLHHAQRHSVIDVRVDGPYGSSSAMGLLRGGDTSILVAGGSGISVVWPLLQALLDAARLEALDTEQASLQEHRPDIVLVWVVRKSDHVHWLGQEAIDSVRAQGVEVVIPAPTEFGRPNVGGILEGCVLKRRSTGRFRAICSGPDSLNRDVRNTCARMVGRGLDVDIEIHKYGW